MGSWRVIAVLALSPVVVLCSSAAVRADLARLGGEFQINASTFSAGGARVAAQPGGGFLVVWIGYEADGDGWGVLGRRFGADATPLGTEFLVNGTTSGDQVEPRVAVAENGSFFVIWTTGYEGAGRGFDAEGNALGPDVVIADPLHPYGFPATSVAATEAAFVVVFSDFHTDFNYSIRARRFAADGEPQGPSFLVDSAYHDTFGAVGGGPDDSFMVVWLRDESLIEGRLFDGDQPRGPRFPVADVNSGFVDGPEICSHDGGGFAVAWATYEPLSYHRVVQYRLYDEAGQPLTDILRATPPRVRERETRPAIACGSGGDFVLVWEEQNRDIGGRRFAAGAVWDFRIAVPESKVGFLPSVAETGGGDFVVTWIECEEDHACAVLGQRFTLSGPVDCPGDCNRDGTVTIDELLMATHAALGSRASLVRRCLPADVDLDYRVSVEELVLGVRHLLEGCP